jgi:hypothetical protein
MVRVSEPWQYLPQMSVPRVFCGAAVVDTNIIIIGGRGDHGPVPSTERGSASLFPSGVTESEGRTQVQDRRSWATVAYGRVRIDCRSASFYDRSGRRVFSGPGPVDVRLTPGIYFARVTEQDDQLVTGTITVVR